MGDTVIDKKWLVNLKSAFLEFYKENSLIYTKKKEGVK